MIDDSCRGSRVNSMEREIMAILCFLQCRMAMAGYMELHFVSVFWRFVLFCRFLFSLSWKIPNVQLTFHG